MKSVLVIGMSRFGSLLAKALTASDNEGFTETPQIEITNSERQIDFTFSGRKFRIVLSAPRS
jgi:hypothetical protein